MGQWKGDSARDKERSAVKTQTGRCWRRGGHDEGYWHWEEKGGGKGGATLIYEMRKDRRDVEQRGEEAKGEDATMKNQS